MVCATEYPATTVMPLHAIQHFGLDEIRLYLFMIARAVNFCVRPSIVGTRGTSATNADMKSIKRVTSAICITIVSGSECPIFFSRSLLTYLTNVRMRFSQTI